MAIALGSDHAGFALKKLIGEKHKKMLINGGLLKMEILIMLGPFLRH